MSDHTRRPKGLGKPIAWGSAKDYCDSIAAITDDEQVQNGCKTFQDLGLLTLTVTEKF